LTEHWARPATAPGWPTAGRFAFLAFDLPVRQIVAAWWLDPIAG